MGVNSKCSYWSNEPVLFTHGFVAAILPGWTGMAVWGSASVAEGAMIVEAQCLAQKVLVFA
jgi:hypothetical protein